MEQSISSLAADFRFALRRLAKAVVIVTCRREGIRFAMAATAVSELSMAPPSMLVCVAKSASIHEPIRGAGRFAINILHHRHRTISENCAGLVKGEARFDTGDWASDADGVPFLRDAQATIFCAVDRVVDYGTHGVFFGVVTSSL